MFMHRLKGVSGKSKHTYAPQEIQPPQEKTLAKTGPLAKIYEIVNPAGRHQGHYKNQCISII